MGGIFRILPEEYLQFINFWVLSSDNYCYGDTCNILGTYILLLEELSVSMDFHQKFSIALHLEDVKFISFLLLSPNHCCHGNTTHFMAIKTFSYSIAVHVFS